MLANALSGDKLKRPELKQQPKRLFDDAAEAAAPTAAGLGAATPAAAALPSNG